MNTNKRQMNKVLNFSTFAVKSSVLANHSYRFGDDDDDGGGNDDDSANNDNGNNNDNKNNKNKHNHNGNDSNNNKDKHGRDWSNNNSNQDDNSGNDDNGGNKDGNNNQNDNDSGEFKMDNLPESAQKYIKGLRKENAGYRTSSKGNETELSKLQEGLKKILGGDEGDQASPEEQISTLSQQTEGLTFRNNVLEVAVANSLNSDQAEYLEFLIQKECGNLEGEEALNDEAIAELVVKARGASKKKGDGNTSVDDNGAPNPNGGDSNEVTAEAFANMGLNAKGKLRAEKPNLYSKLFAEANKKGLL